MNSKPFSTYNLSEILNWLNQIDLQRYSSNFSSMSICGYDLCYLTNSDFSFLGINNLHDKNILIQNIREKTLEQLKLTFSYNKKNVLIQLDFDSNYNIKDLENFLKEIFGLNNNDKIFIMCKNGKEILAPNLKIVDLILLNPQKYKNLIIVNEINDNNLIFNENVYNNNNNNEIRKKENKKCVRNLSNPNFNSSTFDLNINEGSRIENFFNKNNINNIKKENNKINNTTNFYDKNINYERPKINTNEILNNNIIYNLKSNVDVFKNYNKYNHKYNNNNNISNTHNNTFNSSLKMNNSINNLKKFNKENNLNYNNLNYQINDNNNNNN